MQILITGGAGFIGSHIAQHFQGKADVRVLDNLRSGYLKNLDGLEVEFIEGSITDRDAVKRAVKGVDYVFHLGAMISVPDPYRAVALFRLGRYADAVLLLDTVLYFATGNPLINIPAPN